MVQVAITTESLGSAPKELPKTSGFVLFLALMAVMGGFLFGYDTGVVSSAMLFIPKTLELDYTWQQLVVSVTVGACAVFSIIAGFMTEILGRRITIMIASALFTVGAIILCVAPEPPGPGKEVLLVGRIVVGAAVGLASMTVPTYLAEACPAHLRGTMVTGFQLMVTFGLLFSSVLGAAFSYIDPYHVGWRLMMGVAGIPSFIMFIGFFFLPESPRHLITKGRDEEAAKVVARIYGGNKEWIEYELKNIHATHDTLMKEMEEKGGDSCCTLIQVLKTPHVRKAFFLAISLQMFQQLAGVNTLMYYTASIVTMSGIRDPTTAIWMTCAVTGVNFLFTFVPLYLVDRMGRRKLLLGSMLGVISALCFLGVSFLLLNISSPVPIDGSMTPMGANNTIDNFKFCNAMSNCDNCVTYEVCGYCFKNTDWNNGDLTGNTTYGQCLPTLPDHNSVSDWGLCQNSSLTDINTGSLVWAPNWCPSKYKLMPIIAMVIYLSIFSAGMAPMPWVINSEIFPQWARSTGVSWATASNWFFNLIISFTFLTLTEVMTKYGAFFLYAAITCVGFVVFYLFVPETKGKAVEEIELLFMTKEVREQLAKDKESREMEKLHYDHESKF